MDHLKKDMALSKNKFEDLVKTMEEREKDRMYDCTFPPSEKLQEHRGNFPDSLFVQFIGARGVGKSSLINYYISS